MARPEFHETVLPRGPEGLVPEGGWKEGDPLVGLESQAAIQREVGRTEALDLAARVGRAEGTRAAEAVVNREKDAKAGQLKAFKSFLWSLEELAGKDAGAVADPAETRLVFRLYRLEDTGGVKPTAIYQTAVSFGAAEALGMGDPDFEGRAQTWAEKTGRFGRYQWRILGWAAGEQTLDTTYNLNTEAPAGYEAPKAPAVEVAPEPPKDPMSEVMKVLGVAKQFRDALGMGDNGGRLDAASLKLAEQAAAASTRVECDREMRAELRKVEDRWETKLDEARKEARARGMEDGRRAAEDEWRPQVWALERQLETGKEPSLIEEAVKMVGGPEVMASLTQAVITGMNTPRPTPQVRPVVPLQSRVNPQAPPPTQAPPSKAPNLVLPEPTRAQWREALEQTEEALEILAEHGDGSPDTEQLHAVLTVFVEQGQVEGSLGPWWQAWNQVIGKTVEGFLEASERPEEPDGGNIMDMNGMKTMLLARLSEGATDTAILEELDQLTTPQQRTEWRKVLAWVPEAAAAEMIGDGRDPERIKGLLGAFLNRP